MKLFELEISITAKITEKYRKLCCEVIRYVTFNKTKIIMRKFYSILYLLRQGSRLHPHIFLISIKKWQFWKLLIKECDATFSDQNLLENKKKMLKIRYFPHSARFWAFFGGLSIFFFLKMLNWLTIINFYVMTSIFGQKFHI